MSLASGAGRSVSTGSRDGDAVDRASRARSALNASGQGASAVSTASQLENPLNGSSGPTAQVRSHARPLRAAAASLAWLRTAPAAWVLVLVAALALGELPLLIAGCCAPAGASGLGTIWFINDFAQYESAMRQGAQQSGWLIYDVFTVELHQPALMFPLYVALGKLAGFVHLEPIVLERALEPVGRALLVLALWRFCRAFATGPAGGDPSATGGARKADHGSTQAAAITALLLALFGSGLEIFAALIGLPYVGNWSYELNTLGLLLSAPHVPLAMAATLELARLGLAPSSSASQPRRMPGRTGLLAASLGATIALLHPFHLPILLAALLVWAAVARNRISLIIAGAATLGALPILVPTALTFSTNPFWTATYTVQNILPSPMPQELPIDLGATLLLAVGGLLIVRGRLAAPGLLLWLALALVAMYLPVPYQRRFAFGIQPVLAVVAANGFTLLCSHVGQGRAAWLRLGLVALAGSSTAVVIVSSVASAFENAPLAIYRSNRDLDAAAMWLDAHAQQGEIILADWDVSNYLAPRTPARVLGGHPVATLNATTRRAELESMLNLVGATNLSASWLVVTPFDAPIEPAAAPAFQSGGVRIYRTER